MEFSRRKIPTSKTGTMRVCPKESLRPYAILPAPLYVLLRENERFLAVKGPMDFLSPAEIEHLKDFEAFYYPEFIESVLPFRDAGRSLRRLLRATPEPGQAAPAPYELSDAFLRLTSSLWSPAARIEPFFVAIFVSEFCGFLPEELIVRVRERDHATYEQAVLRSSWAVWEAMHLGYLNVDWLRKFRETVFQIVGENVTDPFQYQPKLPELWMRRVLTCDLVLEGARLSAYATGGDQEKLACRAHRLADELISEAAKHHTIFGVEGIIRDPGAPVEVEFPPMPSLLEADDDEDDDGGEDQDEELEDEQDDEQDDDELDDDTDDAEDAA